MVGVVVSIIMFLFMIDVQCYLLFKIAQNSSGSATLSNSDASLNSEAISLSRHPAIPQPMCVTRNVNSGCAFA